MGVSTLLLRLYTWSYVLVNLGHPTGRILILECEEHYTEISTDCIDKIMMVVCSNCCCCLFRFNFFFLLGGKFCFSQTTGQTEVGPGDSLGLWAINSLTYPLKSHEKSYLADWCLEIRGHRNQFSISCSFSMLLIKKYIRCNTLFIIELRGTSSMV